MYRIEPGLQTIQTTIAAFQTVVEVIDRVFANSESASQTDSPSAGVIQQLVNAMEDLHQATEETTHAIRQTKMGISQLNQVALNLQAMI